MSRKRPLPTAQEQRYDETDLLGIKVSHSESLFKEGKDVILTLKDANVLDNEEDVLENVNLTDLERANRNVENKLTKSYNAFDDSEYDKFGQFKKKGLLSKYDEEINGLKKEAFRIGLDASKRLEQLEEIKKSISKDKGEISLEMPKYRIASEYFTEEEIVSFKKPKKSRKSTKQKSSSKTAEQTEKITADSLVPLDNNLNDEDHGSRNRRRVIEQDDEQIDEAFLEHQNLLQNAIKKKIQKQAKASKEVDSSHHHKSKRIKAENKVDIKKERHHLNEVELDDEDDFQIPDEEIYGMTLEEDDLQRDLTKSLDNARKLKQKARLESEVTLEKISEQIKMLNEDELNCESNGLTFESNDRIINSTAEFCRNLGDLSTLKYSKEDELFDEVERDFKEEREEQDDMEIEDDENNELHSSYKQSIRNKWNEVDFETEEPVNASDLISESAPILEEEPDVSHGVAGALKLAMKKGYLDKDINKQNISGKASSLQAKNYTIEEKFYEDDKIGRRERYSGSLSEFKEKSNYKPDIKLEYNDDNGRQLNLKEAFRVLSHKFHGKGPGKNKIDKRMKKLQQESKLKSMTSNDTPLQTTRLLQDKQKELHTHYVILSANQNVLSKKS